MIHPQPTTALLLLARPEERLSRTPVSTRIVTFLASRIGRPGKRSASAAESGPATESALATEPAAATEPAQADTATPHAPGQNPRVHSRWAGRLEQRRRRGVALARRRRGDLHIPGGS